jgi:hypothetical protein
MCVNLSMLGVVSTPPQYSTTLAARLEEVRNYPVLFRANCPRLADLDSYINLQTIAQLYGKTHSHIDTS